MQTSTFASHQSVALTSLSSALAGIVAGLATATDTGAASRQTGIVQAWEKKYLTEQTVNYAAQRFDIALTASLQSGLGSVPVAGPVLAGLISDSDSVVPQGLSALDLVYRIAPSWRATLSQPCPRRRRMSRT
jgi:hypothetical protein